MFDLKAKVSVELTLGTQVIGKLHLLGYGTFEGITPVAVVILVLRSGFPTSSIVDNIWRNFREQSVDQNIWHVVSEDNQTHSSIIRTRAEWLKNSGRTEAGYKNPEGSLEHIAKMILL